MKAAKEFKNNDCVGKTINYKRIEITRFKSAAFNFWKVSVFDTEMILTTYDQNFNKFKDAVQCFDELIDIQLEKLNYQF